MSKIIGYCRVSSKGQMDNNSLEQQREEILNKYPNANVFEEVYTGKTSDRPIFNEVMEQLKEGDTLVVTKLDRFCRSVTEGIDAINQLQSKGINIHILNMGLIEDTPMGKLIVTNLLAFAEFERSMIIERTQGGKAIAKQKPDFKEGRPKKHTKKQLDNAMSMLTTFGGQYSYSEVEEITNISKSTLTREARKRKLKLLEVQK